ncbi:MAG: DUF3592 domain-containing protein [Candidatus Limnocylindria bacterium]
MSDVRTPATGASTSRAPSAFTLIRRNFWLLFGGIFLIAGLLIGFIGAGMLWQESRFASESAEAVGTVLGKSLSQATSDRGTEYFVNYRFTDANGDTRDATDELDFAAWDALVEGGPIPVQYLEGDPATSRMAGDGWWLAWLFLGIGVLTAAIGTALVIPGVRGFRRERRLWTSGTPAWATVTGHEQANVRLNGRYLWHTTYGYEDAAGAKHEGRSNYLGEGEAHGFTVGSRALVRYDAGRPSDSVWIGSTEETT